MKSEPKETEPETPDENLIEIDDNQQIELSINISGTPRKRRIFRI